jgi:hypothetical protein
MNGTSGTGCKRRISGNISLGIRLWNRLPAGILGTLPCKPNASRKRVGKVVNVVNWRECVLNLPINVGSEAKGSALKGGKSGRTVKGTYRWWSEVKWGEVKVTLKLVCSICGLTILETRCITSFPLCYFPKCIVTNCSWSFVYWVIIIECIFVTSRVLFYCTVCTALLHILLPDCWLEVSIWKVLRQATSAQVFLGFPVFKANAEMVPKTASCYCMLLM